MEFPSCICYLKQKAIIFIELKAGAFSVIIFLGTPNLDKICSSKNCMIIVLVAYLMGMASIQFFK